MDGLAMERQIDIQMDQEREHREMDGSKDVSWMDQKMDGSFFLDQEGVAQEVDG